MISPFSDPATATARADFPAAVGPTMATRGAPCSIGTTIPDATRVTGGLLEPPRAEENNPGVEFEKGGALPASSIKGFMPGPKLGENESEVCTLTSRWCHSSSCDSNIPTSAFPTRLRHIESTYCPDPSITCRCCGEAPPRPYRQHPPGETGCGEGSMAVRPR